MARAERSLRITDLYRERLLALAERISAYTTGLWRQQVTLKDFDSSHAAWLAAATAAIGQAQRSGVHLTAGYLAAFLASELDHRTVEIPNVDPSRYAGLAADGQPLTVPLGKTAITVMAALKDSQPPESALTDGVQRATRLAAAAVLAAPRAALAEQIATHPQITGWRRVTRGGCGACLAAAAHGYQRDEPLKVHDHCRYTAEPVIRDVPDQARRQTGPEIFWAMSPEAQDQALGPAAAQAVREGSVAWPQLIGSSPMRVGPDMLTQAPLGAAA